MRSIIGTCPFAVLRYRVRGAIATLWDRVTFSFNLIGKKSGLEELVAISLYYGRECSEVK
jgi:hypothetical protein